MYLAKVLPISIFIYAVTFVATDYSYNVILCPTSLDCKSMDEINLFISESVIMKNFKHRNVLGLIGISVGVEDEIAVPYIVLPFMANGDLKRYLQHQRNNLAVNNPESLFKVQMHIRTFVPGFH